MNLLSDRRAITNEQLVSTDDFAGPLQLQTNLALKGIIGIKAMEGIAKVIDNKEDAKKYKVRRIRLHLCDRH